jgi:Cytochrome C'
MLVRVSILAIVVAWTAPILVSAEEARPPKRARPPVWSRDEVDVFFDDARAALEGVRPDYRAQSPPESSAQASSPRRTDTPAWARLIDSEVLESEAKRLNQTLTQALATPSSFKAGGFKDACRDFSELAVLFAALGQYDGSVRWKDTAPSLRDEFSRTAALLKVGDDETYRVATTSHEHLQSLIRGERPDLPKATTAVDDWSAVAARPQLMQRLNTSQEIRLKKWRADKNAFRRERNEFAHEAQILALLAEVISRGNYDFWDEDEYSTHAHALREAAAELKAAAEASDFDAANRAVQRADKACVDCHNDYRG